MIKYLPNVKQKDMNELKRMIGKEIKGRKSISKNNIYVYYILTNIQLYKQCVRGYITSEIFCQILGGKYECHCVFCK